MVAATTDVETTEVDVSIAMIVEVDLTETIEADDLNAMTVETTAVIGIAPSATTIISLSGMNATDAVSQEETVVAAQTTEDSNAETTDVVATDLVEMTDVVATEEGTTDRTTEWLATGIAPSATMTTLHGELNATSVELQRPVAKDGLLAETTEEVATDLVVMTDVVATEEVAMTDVVVTEEETTDVAEKCSTTTTGIALNATTPISHSARNATDVDYPVAAVNPVLVETIGVVATDVVVTEEVAMTDVVATEEVATTDVVATEEVAMTDVVATADRLAVNLVNNANPENSERLVERDQAMLTTDHLVI